MKSLHEEINLPGWFARNAEKIAMGILCLWCLLPVWMLAYDLIEGLSGKFPTAEELAAQGLTLGSLNYTQVLVFYRKSFYVVGAVTVVFALCCLVLCLRRVFDRKQVASQPWFYLLAGLLAWSVASTLFSGDTAKAFWGEPYMTDGLCSYFIFGAVFLTASAVRSSSRRRNLLRAYCLMVALMAVVMLVQEYGNIPALDVCLPARRSVVFNQFNHFGYVLCMGIAASTGLFLYDGESPRPVRALYLAAVALLTYTLLVNDTFGAWLASVVGLVAIYVFYLRSGREASLAVFLPLALFAAISMANILGLFPGGARLFENLNQFSTDVTNIAAGAEEATAAGTGRWRLWVDTWQVALDHPVFGGGPAYYYDPTQAANFHHPHNGWLQMAAYQGFPALALYLAALLTLAAHHWKAIRQLDPMTLATSGVVVTYLVSSSFGNTVFNTAPFFWMFLGLTTVSTEEELPLLLADERTVARLEAGQSANRQLPALIVVGVLTVAAIVGGVIYAQTRAEASAERADLECMRGSELLAQYAMEYGGVDEKAQFWCDGSIPPTLIPVEEGTPAPYGFGTTRVGGAVEDFVAETGTDYGYDESQDYTDKAILVTIDPEAAEGERVQLAWAEVPAAS